MLNVFMLGVVMLSVMPPFNELVKAKKIIKLLGIVSYQTIQKDLENFNFSCYILDGAIIV